MKTEVPILYDSPEAAKIVTVTGWQAANGRFWGPDEHMARYDGSTHKKCDCGEIIAKNSYCSPCHEKRRREEWLKMPIVEWDNVCMLAIHDGDEYFSELDEFLDWCKENDVLPHEVMLVATKPGHLSEVDVDHWQDDLPEDGELPDEIKEKLDALNKAIEDYKKPVCWHQVSKRIIVETPADWDKEEV